MLQSLIDLATTKPLDVQVWHCDPVLITVNGEDVAYVRRTDVEFTPFESETMIGHCIALTPDADGLRPELAVWARQYLEGPTGHPAYHTRRPGVLLTGEDQFEEPVLWYINGAADRFMIEPKVEPIPYDEETAKIVEQELTGEPAKLNLNSFY